MCRVLQLMNWGFCRLPTLVEPVGFDLFSSSLNCLILVLQLFERVSHTQTHEPQNPGLFVEWQSCCSAKDAVQHQASVGVTEPSAGPWGKTSGGKLGKETGAMLAACLRLPSLNSRWKNSACVPANIRPLLNYGAGAG